MPGVRVLRPLPPHQCRRSSTSLSWTTISTLLGPCTRNTLGTCPSFIPKHVLFRALCGRRNASACAQLSVVPFAWVHFVVLSSCRALYNSPVHTVAEHWDSNAQSESQCATFQVEPIRYQSSNASPRVRGLLGVQSFHWAG